MLKGSALLWTAIIVREFLIEMETTLKEQDYITVLLHELWHVYQHVNGSLRDKRGGDIGRMLILMLLHKDQPWEHEAVDMEMKLYNCYMGSVS